MVAAVKRNDSELFPAHAGMNRTLVVLARERGAVPRTRGDEPS